MTALTYNGSTPTVGADEDTWGTELNTALGEIHTDLGMLNTAAANTILGRNEGTSGEIERLTPAEVAAMLPAVGGDSGSGGTKGLVPAPAAGDAAAEKYLNADGTWGVPKPFAFALINGSDGAIIKGHNIASVSKATGTYIVSFTTAAADANYIVQATGELDTAEGAASAGLDHTTPPTASEFRVRTHILFSTGPTVTLGDVDRLHVTVWQ